MESILTREDLENFVQQAGCLPAFGDRLPFSLPKICPNRWHTGFEEDPWRWRMELARGGNIAYGKFFQQLAGYVAPDCLRAFIALRREFYTAEELYEDGLLSRECLQLYRMLREQGGQPAHALKQKAGLTGKKGSRFDAAMVQLQMRMLVCICGSAPKISRQGIPYGWEAACYDTIEHRFGEQEAMETEEAMEFLLFRILSKVQAEEKEVRSMLDPFRKLR